MTRFTRYAIYYAPAPGGFAEAAAHWLGRDARSGRALPHPPAPAGLARLTEEPRRYGFHATLKAPFRLSEGATQESLLAGLEAEAARLAPLALPGLRLADLAGFLALVPDAGPQDLARLGGFAARVVEAFEPFRAPLSPTELARRRPESLSSRQRELLARWGYPYVAEEFRFHMTLSGPLTDVARLKSAAAAHFGAHLPRPFTLDALTLFGEQADGSFLLLHRAPLSGSESPAPLAASITPSSSPSA